MPTPSALRLPTWSKRIGWMRESPRAVIRACASVSATSSTMMISEGSCSLQVRRQSIRMSTSSWKDGTITEVVVRKALSIGGAVQDSSARISDQPHDGPGDSDRSIWAHVPGEVEHTGAEPAQHLDESVPADAYGRSLERCCEHTVHR